MPQTDIKDVYPSLQKLITESERVILKLDSLVRRFEKHIFTKEEIIEIYDAWVEAERFVVVKRIWFVIPGIYNICIYDNPQELKKLIDTWDEKRNLVRFALTRREYTLVLVTNTWDPA
jgi:hypothetical protein